MSGLEELRALVEEMRATLEPLRRYYDLNDCDDRDDDDALEIPIADLRRTLTALTRAESSLASPAGMEGWMPIATAPKDGTWVFLFVPGHGPARARWNERMCGWASHTTGREITRATHWMPLPAAPRGESE